MIKIEGKPVEEEIPLTVKEISPDSPEIQRKWVVKQGEQVLGYVIYKRGGNVNRIFFTYSGKSIGPRKEENIISTRDNVVNVKVILETDMVKEKRKEGIIYELVTKVIIQPRGGSEIERQTITGRIVLTC